MIKDKTEIYYLGNNNSIRYFSYYKTQNRQKNLHQDATFK